MGKSQPSMIGPGDTNPIFTVSGTDGNSIEKYSLTGADRDSPTAPVCYLFDCSPICAEQLSTLRGIEWSNFSESVDVWDIPPWSASGLPPERFGCHETVPEPIIEAVDGDPAIRTVREASGEYQAPSLDTVEETIARDQDETGVPAG